MIQLRHVQKYCCNVTTTTTTSTTTTTTTIAENQYMVTSCDGVYTYIVSLDTPLSINDVFTTSTSPLNNTCYTVVSKTAQAAQVAVNVENIYSDCNYCLNNYTISADTYTVDEGSDVIFTITNPYGEDGTLTFEVKTNDNYTVDGAFRPNDVALNTGNIVFANGVGTFTITAVADNLTEGFHSFYVQIYKNGVSIGYSPTITINDTSVGNPLVWLVQKVGTTDQITVSNKLYKFSTVDVGKFVQLLGVGYPGCYEVISETGITPVSAITSVHDTNIC